MIIKNIVRFGIVAGVIMYSQQLGVWETADETEEIYNRSTELAQPYADGAMKRSGFQMPPLPPDGQWAYLAVYSYNTVVKGTFNMLSMMPTYMRQFLIAVPDYIHNAFTALGNIWTTKKSQLHQQILPRKPRYEDDFTYLQPGVDKKRKRQIPDAKCHCGDSVESGKTKKADEAYQKGYKERVEHEDYHYYQPPDQDKCECDKCKEKKSSKMKAKK